MITTTTTTTTTTAAAAALAADGQDGQDGQDSKEVGCGRSSASLDTYGRDDPSAGYGRVCLGEVGRGYTTYTSGFRVVSMDELARGRGGM